MLPFESVGKHGTEMIDVLVMHFIAKAHTNGRSRFTGVVATTGNRTELYTTVFNFVQPKAINLRGNRPAARYDWRYAAYNVIEFFASSGHVGPGA